MTNNIKLFNSRLNSMLRGEVTPLLKEHGFKKKYLIYSRALSEVSWLIDIQKNRWNSQSEWEFTMNCGVHVPGFWTVYAKNLSEPTKLEISYCPLSARIGMLPPRKRDIWWKLTPDDDSSVDIATAKDMRFKVESLALPFLNKFHSSLEVANFLSSDLSKQSDLGKQYKYIDPMAKTKRFSFSAIINFNLGNKEKAIRLLDKAIKHEISKKSPLECVINDLKDLKCDLLR